MKKIAVLFILLLMTGISGLVMGQPGDPPANPTSPNGGGNGPVGGGAPIGSGLVILLALGAGYSGKKVYDFRKKNNSLQEL